MFEFLLNLLPCINGASSGESSNNTHLKFKLVSSCCKKRKQVIIISSDNPEVINDIMDYLGKT